MNMNSTFVANAACYKPVLSLRPEIERRINERAVGEMLEAAG